MTAVTAAIVQQLPESVFFFFKPLLHEKAFGHSIFIEYLETANVSYNLPKPVRRRRASVTCW